MCLRCKGLSGTRVLTIGCREKVSDAVLEKEKDKPVGQVFDAGFSWAEMLNAAADVYLGVTLPRLAMRYARHANNSCSLRSGPS